MESMQWIRTGVLACAFAFVAAGAHAETVKLVANLQPSSNVPPTTSRGSGALDATFDTPTHTLQWIITYRGLSGPATAAHFHGPAPVGQTAAVQISVEKGALASPIRGAVRLNDTQVTDLMAGKWYVDIHTQADPMGEIRGQILPTP